MVISNIGHPLHMFRVHLILCCLILYIKHICYVSFLVNKLTELGYIRSMSLINNYWGTKAKSNVGICNLFKKCT